MRPEDIGDALHEALYEEPAFAMLAAAGCGWVDGGCRSLMRALVLLLGDAATPYQIVQSEDQRNSEHALVRVGDWYLDGDGVSSETELIRRWYEDEELDRVVLRPFDPDQEPPEHAGERSSFCLDEARVCELAELIDAKVGREALLSLRG